MRVRKKGFTLVELVISMSLLSFVIMMASLLFDRAIHVSPKLRDVITNSSKSYSEFENMIYRLRKDSSSFSTLTEFRGLDIKINGVEIKNVRGHLISYDGTQVKLDGDVSIDHQLFTFVGNGHRESPTVKMKNSLITTASVGNRFRFFPVSSGNISVSYQHESESGANLKKIRSRTLKSTAASNSEGFLHAPYVDAVEMPNTLGRTLLYSGLNSPSESGFEYVGEAADGADNANTHSGSFTIYGHADNKQEYFDATDKTFAVGGFTLNKNGHIGAMVSSLTNTIIGEQNAIYLIGLPYSADLVGFYDYNLLIAPSSTKPNHYYSLYNPEAAKDTAYHYSGTNPDPSQVIFKAGSAYGLNWGNRDVRNILGLSTVSPKLKLAPGALPGGDVELIAEGATIKADYVGAQKSYGASAYYHNDVSGFNADLNKEYTFFVKFNMENYNEEVHKKSETSPIALFYHNWSLDDGAPLIGGGFMIFADKDGELYLNTQNEAKKLNFNLKKDANLYKDLSEKAKFQKLDYDSIPGSAKRDGRERFLILSFNVKRSNRQVTVKMNVLKSKITTLNVGGSTTEVPTTEVHTFSEIKIPLISGVDAFRFGGLLKRANTGSGIMNLEDPLNGQGAIEVSDLLLYESNLSSKSVGTSDFQSLTMEYLYRKYLTDQERKEVGYDEYFIPKY